MSIPLSSSGEGDYCSSKEDRISAVRLWDPVNNVISWGQSPEWFSKLTASISTCCPLTLKKHLVCWMAQVDTVHSSHMQHHFACAFGEVWLTRTLQVDKRSCEQAQGS